MVDYPILNAYETARQYAVWCVHCRKWHWHGKADGHRAAHCFSADSPYQATGYVIRRVGTWDERPTCPHCGLMHREYCRAEKRPVFLYG